MPKLCTLVAATVAVSLVFLMPQTARAQSDQAPGLAPQCPPGAAPRLDTADVIVGIRPSAGWHDSKYNVQQKRRIQYYADAIRQHFTPPATLGELPMLGDRSENPKQQDDGDRSVLGGTLALIVTPEGRIRTLAWEHAPLSVLLGNAITMAAAAADSAGDFDGIPRPKGALDTLSLTLVSRRTTLPDDAFPLMRARVLSYVIQSPASVLKSVVPDYPENAKAMGVDNTATLTYIVGSDGRAVMSSFQLTRTNWAEFEAPMRASIASSTYRPARSGGCSVPILVQQPFDFRMRRY